MPNIKGLFSSRKKAALTLACAGVILVTIGACIVVYAVGRSDRGSAIGGGNAQNFAFADAGVDSADARAVSVDYERFQDKFVYEVEFTAGDTEYEYKIDAEDGSVVKKESRTVLPLDDGSPAVTLEEAQAIALADAGLAQEQVELTGAELGTEQGMPVYQIKFRADNTEYAYQINAQTGRVYSKRTVVYAAQAPGESPAPAQTDPPARNPVPDAQASQPPAASAPPSAPVSTPRPTQQPSGLGYIDVEAAKNAALSDAGVDASQAMFTRTRMEREDGVTVYELEFRTSTHEYEYEINAATGAVHSRSVEAFAPSGGRHSEPQPSPDAALVGLDAAKSAALAHAGCSADEVVFTKAELDYDNGRAVYDIEFRKGRAEYEYEIDAAAGDVLEYDWDLD